MANANPYLILRRVRDSVIRQLRDLFRPENNTAVPNFAYPYYESASTGYIQFFGNPANGNTFTIGANTLTFVTGVPVGLQVKIGATQQITQANLVAKINANSTLLGVAATTNTIPGQVNLKANISGLSGNTIVLVISSPVLRVSAPTLREGGLFDFDRSEIFISDAIPQDYQDWPCLIVDTALANETRYLGPEDLSQAKNSFGVVIDDKIFSSLVVTVNINLYTIDDTIARDEIIDLIYNNISEIRDDLASHGIEMIRRTLPNETRTFQDQRQYITNRFMLELYCEWTDDLLPIVNVGGLNISIPLDSHPIPVITSPISFSYSQGLTFNVESIIDGTHLVVTSTTGLSNGDTIVQGVNTTTITTVTDLTHLVVGNTAGWVTGIAQDTSVNLPFSYQITAMNNPTTYGATGLPTGLSIDTSNGLISGTPTQTGTFYVSLSATNSTGTGVSPLTLTIS